MRIGVYVYQYVQSHFERVLLLLQIPLCYANRSCALDRHKGFRYHYSFANKIVFNVFQTSNARSADNALSIVRLDPSVLLVRMPMTMIT